MMTERSHRRPCAALSELESALLWCMRAWVIGHRNNQKVSGRIEAVFTKLGTSGAAVDLNRFMWALSQGALRTIEINCVCCPEVSEDEQLLLDAFALQQREHHEDVYAILAHVVTESAAVIACDHAQRLTLALMAVERILPTPPHSGVRQAGVYGHSVVSRYLH